jgi:protein-tyrosine phosphatase
MDDRFRILVVCTANICRSPMIERMLRHGLVERLGTDAARFEVASAGTWGHDGPSMHEFSAQVLTDRGIDASGFSPRVLAAEMVDQSDLVLTAAREHRAAVVTMRPSASRRTFTLLEFARLLGPVDPATLPTDDVVARARALVEEAAGNRGLVPPDRPEDDDLVDPIGRPLSAFRDASTTVHDAIEVVLRATSGARRNGA